MSRQYESMPDSLAEASEEFRKAYWDWWDSNPNIRKMFNDYPADMSHVYFYNKVWRKRDDKST